MRRLWPLLPVLAGAFATPARAIDFYLGLGAGGVRVESSDYKASSDASETDGLGRPYSYHYVGREFQGGDIGWKGFVGARFGRYFSIEGGYVDLGNPERDTNYILPPGPTTIVAPGPITDPVHEIYLQQEPVLVKGYHACTEGAPPTGDCPRPTQNDVLTATTHIRGFEGFAVGRFPFAEKWEVFAKLGVLGWQNTYTVRDKIAEEQSKTLPPRLIAINVTPSSPVHTDGVDLAAGLGFNYQASKHFTLRTEGTWYDVKNTSQAWMVGFDVIYGFAF